MIPWSDQEEPVEPLGIVQKIAIWTAIWFAGLLLFLITGACLVFIIWVVFVVTR